MSMAESTVGEGQQLNVETLSDYFARTPRFALAFSGGCDSSYLLAAALDAGCEVSAYCVKTAFQAGFELDDAYLVLDAVRAKHPDALAAFHVLDLDILSHSDICANPPERCYLCKSFILGAVRDAARADGFTVLVDGTNATDDPARRPGFRALTELGVVSPLRRAGMTKDDVRAASREAGVPTADKPSFSCLATAVPAGCALTQETLAQAAVARKVDNGKRPWRVGAASNGALSRKDHSDGRA